MSIEQFPKPASEPERKPGQLRAANQLESGDYAIDYEKEIASVRYFGGDYQVTFKDSSTIILDRDDTLLVRE